MRDMGVALALLAITWGAAWAAENAPPSRAEIMQEIKQLRAALAAVEEKARTLEELTQKRAAEKPEFRTVNMALVRRIRFPATPSREAMRLYVQEILTACKDQSSFNSNDAPVAMLAKIGPDNLDLLLEAMKDNGNFYVQLALKALVTDENKELVIEALPRQQALVDAVVERGWAADARDILCGELHKRPKGLPVAWIQAVASFQNPETYEDLKWYLENGNNCAQTCRSIKDLPGIKADEVVATAWTRAQKNAWNKKWMVEMALQYGHLDALEFAVNALTVDANANEGLYQARRIVLDALPQAQGTDGEVQKWFRENKERLVFDAATKSYKLRPEAGK